MIIVKYLIINSRGNVTLREREPRLAGNEIALKINLEIPSELFKRPVLEAKMTIPPEAVPRSIITPSITSNIERIVKEATGLNIAISVVEQVEDTQQN